MGVVAGSGGFYQVTSEVGVRQHVSSCRFCANKSQRWIWMSSRGSGWTAALWPHPETHGAHHRHIARHGVHRRPETVGKCCVSSSDRPAHHHLPLPLNHTPTTAYHTARPANPRISDRCRMSTHVAALSPGGGVWPSCFPGLRYSASGAQHPPLTLVPRGGRAGLLRIPGRSVLLSGTHTSTLGV